MADVVDELVRVPENLVGYARDEAETCDEALHLVLFPNLNAFAELLTKELVELVGSSACRHDFDGTLHELR